MKLAISALAIAMLFSGPVIAREPDNPCPTCCAQLKEIHDKMETKSMSARAEPRVDKEEIETAMKAGLPGDPHAEVHCAYLVKKLREEGVAPR